MPKNLRQDEIKSILEIGNFDKLIGTIENEQLDFKKAPYQLDTDLEKLELVKDISSFANADGGVILLGVRTERDPKHFGDEAKEICPFLQTLVDPDKYHNILSSWIYPILHHIEIKWFPAPNNPERGIIAIFIPSQPTTKRPFLITKSLGDNNKKIEIVFGYAERRRANATPTSVQEIHTLMRDGINYGSLNQKIENIQETIQYFITEQSHLNGSVSQLDFRISIALGEAGLAQSPAIILVAAPIQPVKMPTLFLKRDADIVRLLEQPPELRSNGFDLNTGESPRIVKGQFRRACSPGYKVLELWRDGTLIFAAAGGSDFLCWGKHNMPGGPLRINPLALIESTYLFADLSRHVFEQASPNPQEIEYRLGLINMTIGDTPCLLIPGPIDSFDWTFGGNIQRAPDSHKTFTVTEDYNSLEPGDVAFDLVAELYAWFGIEQDQIPYIGKKDRRFVVSPDLIQKAGK